MSKKLFVGGIAFSTTEDALRDAFAEVGPVESVKIIKDRDTGRSRGFGFVEMESEDAGKTAIERMNNTQLDGRTITVNVARSRDSRPGGGGGRGRDRW